VQCPPEHGAAAGHAVPHAPQFALSLIRFTQLPLQLVVPPVQVSAHAPAMHTDVGAHA
jgi:hypothetical protein